MASGCSLCGSDVRRQRRNVVLVAPLALLALSASAPGLGFTGSFRPRSPCRSPLSALAARGGESVKEALGLQSDIPLKRAVGELDFLLQHLFRPQPSEKASLVEWSMDEKNEDSNPNGKAYQASLTIVPLNQTFRSGWVDSGIKANKEAAQSALSHRLGDNSLGDVQAALSQILRNALDGEDLSMEVQEAAGGFQSTVGLPAKLFAGDAPPEALVFMGEGKSKQEARQSAAWKALLYLCGCIGALPALKALSDGAKKARSSTLGKGSSTVLFGNFNPEASEESIRQRFEQFGKVTDLELKKGKSRIKGSATYEHRLSAWIAPRIMDRSAVDGHAIFVTQRGAKVDVLGRLGSQISWGKVTSPDSVLFYKNAPFKESWTDMLGRFQEVGDVKSFRFWVEEKTRKSKGSGTIGFASPKAAKEALERLQGMDIDDRKLEVQFYKKHEKTAE